VTPLQPPPTSRPEDPFPPFQTPTASDTLPPLPLQPEDPFQPWDGRMHPAASDADIRRRMRTRMTAGWPCASPPTLANTPVSSSLASSRRSSSPLVSPSRSLFRGFGSLTLLHEEERDRTPSPLGTEPLAASTAAFPTARLVGRCRLLSPHHTASPLGGGIPKPPSAATLHLSAALGASDAWALAPPADSTQPRAAADGEACAAVGDSDRARALP
jgi:hypothetical protein